MCWHSRACRLPPYPVEQGKQGIQGFGARTCFCRFCSLQLGTSFSDHEFPWLKLRHVGSSSPSCKLSGSESSLVPFNLGCWNDIGYPLAFILKWPTVWRHKLKLATQHLHTTSPFYCILVLWLNYSAPSCLAGKLS